MLESLNAYKMADTDENKRAERCSFVDRNRFGQWASTLRTRRYMPRRETVADSFGL